MGPVPETSGREMVCPKCQGAMARRERGSVAVDQCTSCGGIFLDRGELELLVEAENAWHVQAPPPVSYSGHGGAGLPGRAGARPSKSFLEELFDAGEPAN